MIFGSAHYRRILLSLAMLVGCGTAQAAGIGTATPWAGFDGAPVRLVSGQTATGDADAVQFGLQIKVSEGWKTYWRYPGEAGAAPRMNWNGSDNVAGITVDWPAPYRFSAFGFDNFGYDSNVILPITLTPKIAGAPVTLALKLDYLICSDICVPGQADLRLSLPEGSADSSEFAGEIAEFRRQVPKRGPQSPFALSEAAVEGEPGNENLRLTVSTAEPLTQPELLVEVAQPLSLGRPQVTLSDDGRQADVRMKVFDGGSGKSLAGQAMRLTLIDGARAGEHVLRVSR